MNRRDRKYAIRLLAKEWNLGARESGAPKWLCAKIYLAKILHESETLICQRDDNGRLIGFAGYAKWRSRRHLLRKLFYGLQTERLMKHRLVKNRLGMKSYHEIYDTYIPEDIAGKFDGELSIIILDSRFRGKGLGEKMIEDIFRLARKDGVRRLQILTDESCNFNFYTKVGCKKVFETTVVNKESGSGTERAFVYMKEL